MEGQRLYSVTAPQQIAQTERTMNEFTKQAKAKGWPMKAIAERWGVSPRRMSQIAAEPKQKDWDALNGLPSRKEA